MSGLMKQFVIILFIIFRDPRTLCLKQVYFLCLYAYVAIWFAVTLCMHKHVHSCEIKRFRCTFLQASVCTWTP